MDLPSFDTPPTLQEAGIQANNKMLELMNDGEIHSQEEYWFNYYEVRDWYVGEVYSDGTDSHDELILKTIQEAMEDSLKHYNRYYS